MVYCRRALHRAHTDKGNPHYLAPVIWIVTGIKNTFVVALKKLIILSLFHGHSFWKFCPNPSTTFWVILYAHADEQAPTVASHNRPYSYLEVNICAVLLHCVTCYNSSISTIWHRLSLMSIRPSACDVISCGYSFPVTWCGRAF